MMVAVRRGDKFVRGKVEEIFTNTRVRVLMTDWGEMVEESTDNLRNIPNNIKVPKSNLAHRLVVWERVLVEEEVEMVKDIVEECKVGWLEGIGQSECGQFVTGKLRVKMTPDMKVKYKDRLDWSLVGDMVMVDSLLGRRRVTEKMKQTIRSKLEMLKRSSILLNVNASHTEEKVSSELEVNTCMA